MTSFKKSGHLFHEWHKRAHFLNLKYASGLRNLISSENDIEVHKMACLPSCSLDSGSSLLHLISTSRGSCFPSWGHDIANLHPPRVPLVLKPIPDPLTSSRPANYIRVLRGVGLTVSHLSLPGRDLNLWADSRQVSDAVAKCHRGNPPRCRTKKKQENFPPRRDWCWFCAGIFISLHRVGSSFEGCPQNSWLYFFPTTAERQSMRGSGIMPQIPHR